MSRSSTKVWVQDGGQEVPARPVGGGRLLPALGSAHSCSRGGGDDVTLVIVERRRFYDRPRAKKMLCLQDDIW